MNLVTRFDTRALRPPSPSESAAPAALLAWCRAGTEAFAWRATDASTADLDALMRELDGDRALQAMPSRAAQLRYRLGLKAREALGLRRADDPWDCGWLRDAEALLQFEPRRPTLIVATSADCRAMLAARQHLFKHAVRLLAQPSSTKR